MLAKIAAHLLCDVPLEGGGRSASRYASYLWATLDSLRLHKPIPAPITARIAGPLFVLVAIDDESADLFGMTSLGLTQNMLLDTDFIGYGR